MSRLPTPGQEWQVSRELIQISAGSMQISTGLNEISAGLDQISANSQTLCRLAQALHRICAGFAQYQYRLANNCSMGALECVFMHAGKMFLKLHLQSNLLAQ